MRRNTLLRSGFSLPERLLATLAMADCLQRLGCSESDAARLVGEWLEDGAASVVGRVAGPSRTAVASVAAA